MSLFNITVVQHQRTLKSRLEEEKANLRKCVKLTEDARAAEVRASKNKVRIDPSSTGKIIEIDPYAEDVVDDSTKAIHNPPSDTDLIETLQVLSCCCCG